MSGFLDGFHVLPAYGKAAVAVIVLFLIQTELRFGAKARSYSTGAADRGSTLALSFVIAVPIFGFVLAMKTHWFRPLPGMPAAAWAGVCLGLIGFAVRLWAVLTLRERYTRTLQTHDAHAVEQRGPYRWVRHPGYLGSLLCLNGIALASGALLVLLVSLVATVAAYAWRIRVEDAMLVQRFGETYAAYRRRVRALIPTARR